MLVPCIGQCSCDPSRHLIGERNYDADAAMMVCHRDFSRLFRKELALESQFRRNSKRNTAISVTELEDGMTWGQQESV